MTMTEIMAEKMIHSLPKRLKEVNDIIGTRSGAQMPFEQAYVIARFYYDYQDTNVLIDEAENLVAEDAVRLREFAVSLKDETAALFNHICDVTPVSMGLNSFFMLPSALTASTERTARSMDKQNDFIGGRQNRTYRLYNI